LWRQARDTLRGMGEVGHHAALIRQTIASPAAAARSALAASWCRSALRHGLDPENGPAAERLASADLAHAREARALLLYHARSVMDVLARAIVRNGRCLLLTDENSTILEGRITDSDLAGFDRARLVPGECWSEAVEGTNGIGTCLAEDRPVTIHREQHFLDANTQVSCIGVPIHDADGRIIAALDVSTNRFDHNADTAALLMAALLDGAQVVERQLFTEAFRDCRIMLLGSQPGAGPAMVAVDCDDLVIGANRAARQHSDLTNVSAASPVPVADLFGAAEQDPLAAAERRVLRQALARSGGNVAAAARSLGIGRATFYRRMERAGLN